jgi:hypothetical protein
MGFHVVIGLGQHSTLVETERSRQSQYNAMKHTLHCNRLNIKLLSTVL